MTDQEEYSPNLKPCNDDEGPLLQSESCLPHKFSIIETESSSMEATEENSSDRGTHSKCTSSSSSISKEEEEKGLHSPPAGDVTAEVRSGSEALEDNSGRERLKKHRTEVAGSVWIPDIWGQEELLKDWINCSAFDASLEARGIMSARAALVEEGRRANSRVLRIENRC